MSPSQDVVRENRAKHDEKLAAEAAAAAKAEEQQKQDQVAAPSRAS